MRYMDIDQEFDFIPVAAATAPVAHTSESLTVRFPVGAVVVSAAFAMMLPVGDVKTSWELSTSRTEVAVARAPPKLSNEQMAIATAADRLFVRLGDEPAGGPDPDYGF